MSKSNNKSKYLFVLSIFVIAVWLLFLTYKEYDDSTAGVKTYSGGIISLAPSTTEILFTLGLDDRIAAVTKFCDYPEAAKSKIKIGGFVDINYELIVSLRPEAVIVFSDQQEVISKLKNLNIKMVLTEHKTIEDILDAVKIIGAEFGKEQAAAKLIADIEKKMELIKTQSGQIGDKSVMICVDHNMTSSKLENAVIAGKDGYYSSMIELAGGKNAYKGNINFPMISTESVVSMNPDVIIDIIADFEKRQVSAETIMNQWQQITEVNAVKNKQVYLFRDDFSVVPGPRFILTLEKIAKTINPDFTLNENDTADN